MKSHLQAPRQAQSATLVLRAVLVLLLVCGQLSGCGFTLTGQQSLPLGLEQVRIVSAAEHAPLTRALKERLKLYRIPQAQSVENAPGETVTLSLLPDTLDRRLLSLFSSGQVAEYELVLSVAYQVHFPYREPMQVEFDITREYQDDPDAVLAKSRELRLVLKEMRQKAADRIIRLLASQWDRSEPLAQPQP